MTWYRQHKGECLLQEIVQCCDNALTGATQKPENDNTISASFLQVRLCCIFCMPVNSVIEGVHTQTFPQAV